VKKTLGIALFLALSRAPAQNVGGPFYQVPSCVANQTIYYAATGNVASCDTSLTDNGTTLVYSGTGGVKASGGPLTAGSASCTYGTAGALCLGNGTAPTPAVGYELLYAATNGHLWVSDNGQTGFDSLVNQPTAAPTMGNVMDNYDLSVNQLGLFNPTALEAASTAASGVLQQAQGGTGVASTAAVITSTFSFTATAFSTAATTQLLLSAIPASTTRAGRCDITWEQLTAASTVQFGIGNSVAPTNESVSTWMSNDSATVRAFDYTTHTNTTPSAITAANTTATAATAYSLEVDFTVTSPAIAPLVVGVWAVSGSSSDAVQVEPGSYCAWL
jgi:hypothetical protein